MRRTHAQPLLIVTGSLLAWTCGCALDDRPAISSVNPLNGATAVGLEFHPMIRLARGTSAALSEGDGRLVLQDVTAGQRRTVAGEIVIEDDTLTYEPAEALAAGHRYELVLQREAVEGEKLLDVDGSEWPDEPFEWPFRARFATFSAPQVRAAYLERVRGGARLIVRFSQPMDQVVTNDQFQVLDQGGGTLPIDRPVWVDDSSARIDIKQELDPAGLYSLQVFGGAQAVDGTRLDGDRDGQPGEAKDALALPFTGSEKIVLSRLALE